MFLRLFVSTNHSLPVRLAGIGSIIAMVEQQQGTEWHTAHRLTGASTRTLPALVGFDSGSSCPIVLPLHFCSLAGTAGYANR